MAGRQVEHGRDPKSWVLWVSTAFTIAILALHIPSLFAEGVLWPDDLMRLQQVRDLRAGQSWFDTDQHRYLTPEGGDMHWSRLPDIFLLGLISLLTPFVGSHWAELLTAGIWPLFLFAAAIALMFSIAERLGVGRIGQFCVLAFFMGSAASANFWPGRIDHHGVVVVFVLSAFAALISRTCSVRSALILAVSVCAAVSVAVEALPYACAILCLAGINWVIRGPRETKRMIALGLGLILFSALFYALDAPGLRNGRMVCDAYGASHLAALTVAGGLFAAIGKFGDRFPNWRGRIAIGFTAAAITFIVFVSTNPDCLGDPYGALPDTVRESWLGVVVEAQSLRQLIQHDFARGVWVFGFMLAALTALFWMIRQSESQFRLAWLNVLVMLVLGITMTAWQVRGQLFSHVFAVLAASGAVGAIHPQWKRQHSAQALLALVMGFAILSPLTWRFAGDQLFKPDQGHELSKQYAIRCMDRERFREIAHFPLMRIHTPIDLGVPILSFTDHSVFAAPYHRNVRGIVRATEVLTGDLDQAHSRLIAMGATHLAYCVGLPETDRYGSHWPNSLSAEMNHGRVPNWLMPLEPDAEIEGVLRIYAVKPMAKPRTD